MKVVQTCTFRRNGDGALALVEELGGEGEPQTARTQDRQHDTHTQPCSHLKHSRGERGSLIRNLSCSPVRVYCRRSPTVSFHILQLRPSARHLLFHSWWSLWLLWRGEWVRAAYSHSVIQRQSTQHRLLTSWISAGQINPIVNAGDMSYYHSAVDNKEMKESSKKIYISVVLK